MAVNENLAALMNLIEEYQDKMPEGEYLKAMNALGALHREMPVAAPVYGGVGGAAAVYHHHPPSYNESVSLLAAAGLEERVDRAAWYRVTNEHPDHFGITYLIWKELPQEERDLILREATECVVNQLERHWINPDPETCPFIARHAVGGWRLGTNEHQYWECVCGYTGKTKHWQKHEQSERHQNWAKHRTVSRRIITKMKKAVEKNEQGELCRYKPQSRTEFGGIRYFPINQERNEWTHPELYADPVRRNPIPTADGGVMWFVHPRVQRHNSREYLD